MNNQTSRRGGVGFAGMLTIAFVVLKLCHVINWRWVWVLSPLWIVFALCLIIIICGAIAGGD